MKDFEYLEPRTVAEACGLLKRYAGEARVYAGGAYLSIVMKQGLLQPKALVNIKKISGLGCQIQLKITFNWPICNV